MRTISAFALLAAILLVSGLVSAQQSYPGGSGRSTYIYSITQSDSTAAIDLSFEASATRGFRIAEVCYNIPPATASARATHHIARTNTASSAGSAIPSNATSIANIGTVFTVDPTNDPVWIGVARYGGTPGSIAAIIDQWDVYVPLLTQTTPAEICRQYGMTGGKMPVVRPGVANGLTIRFAASGAGAVAMRSVRITLLAD
jgi:hypothetical protein